MKEKLTIIKGSIALTIAGIVSAVCGFVASVIIARFLETATYGLFIFIIATAGISYLFTDFGIDSLANYFVQRYMSTRKDIVKFVMFSAAKIKILLTLFVFASLISLGYFYDWRFYYVAAFFIFFAPHQYVVNFLPSFQKFELSGLFQTLESIIRLAIVYFAIEYVTVEKLSIVIIAFMLPMVISILFVGWDIVKYLRGEDRVSFQDIKDETTYYWKWFFAMSLFGPVIANAMQILTGLMKGLEQLAIFGVGQTLSNMILILSTSFRGTITPSFMKKNDKDSLSFALTDLIRYMLIVCVFLAFFVHFTSEPITTIFYGGKYKEAAIVFEILTYGILFNMVFIGLTPAMMSTGRPDIRVKLSVLNPIIAVFSGLFLIPKYGALGAAISYSSGQIFPSIPGAIISYRILKFRFPWKTLTNCLFSCSIVFIPLEIISLGPVYSIFLNFFAGIAIYIVVLYLIGEIENEDTKILKNLFQRGGDKYILFTYYNKSTKILKNMKNLALQYNKDSKR